MSDRAYARAVRKQEVETLRLLEVAGEEIARSEALRFLVGRLFEVCGMATNPFTSDPLTTAHACGMMAVGEELRALIETASPDLYYDIQKEYSNGQRERNTDLTDRFYDNRDE